MRYLIGRALGRFQVLGANAKTHHYACFSDSMTLEFTRVIMRHGQKKHHFGQIKQARGFRQFLLRGIEKVRGEWALICMTHNLLKFHKICYG